MRTEQEITMEVKCQSGYEEYLQSLTDSPIAILPAPFDIYRVAFLDGYETRAIEETEKPKLRRRGK